MDSKLIDIKYVDKDEDVVLISSDGKSLVCNTDRINPKASKSSQGSTGMKLNEECKIVLAKIKPNKEAILNITLIDDKQIEMRLDDIAPTNRPNEERSIYFIMQDNNKATDS